MGCHGSGKVADTSIIGRIVGTVMSREMECPDCGGIATARMPAELIRLYDEWNYVSSLCDLSKKVQAFAGTEDHMQKRQEIAEASGKAWWKKLKAMQIHELASNIRTVVQITLGGNERIPMTIGNFRNISAAKSWKEFLTPYKTRITKRLEQVPPGDYYVKVHIKKNTPPNPDLVSELDGYYITFDYSHLK